MNIIRTSVKLLYADPQFKTMVEEYATYAIKRLPRPQYRQEDYEPMEQAGIMAVFAALHEGNLAGFAAVLETKIPHYGLKLSVVESLFVRKAFRKTGAGLRLIRRAEDHARSLGAAGIFINCPYGQELAKVLPRLDYTPETLSHFKPL